MDNSDLRSDAGQLLRVWRRFFSRKTVLLVVGIVVAIACIVFGIWFVVHRSEINKQQQAAQKKVNAALTVANNDMNNANFAKSITVGQNALSQASTNAQKAEVYGSMALAASNEGNYSQAITYYTDEHTLNPSTTDQDAMSMAQDYVYLRDNTDAIKYYKIALEYYNANPSKTNPGLPGTDPRTEIKSDLQELGQ